ncbi:hypothetical protein ASD66_05140 [Nocardioides sp. Root151]|nr:hypothetical protein ASD30_21415 [Nocardioides sp. Root140]KQZ75718.1 hypothetical protein ASD66_05140 [Nocardioides sp. Root151]
MVVPSTPLMIAAGGTADPLAGVRALALDSVRWLVASSPDRIQVLCSPADPANVARGVTTPLGERVARSLLSAAGFDREIVVSTSESESPVSTGVLIVGDGSARRGEKAPGHLDDRAFTFDSTIESALRACDADTLATLSVDLGAELLAAGVPAFRALGALAGGAEHTCEMTYSGDPLGVQYWVARWQCAS